MNMNSRKIIMIIVGAIILAILLVIVDSDEAWFFRYDVDDIQDMILAYGFLGRFVFLLMGFFRPLMVLPVSFFFVTGGLAFGTLEGSFWALMGMGGSTTLIYLVSGRFHGIFRRRVNQKYVEKLDRITEKDLVPKIFSIRVTPGMPFDSITAAAGVAGVKYKPFMTGTFLGMLPKGVLYTYLGDNLDQYLSPETLIVYGILISMAIAPHVYNRIKRSHRKKTGENH